MSSFADEIAVREPTQDEQEPTQEAEASGVESDSQPDGKPEGDGSNLTKQRDGLEQALGAEREKRRQLEERIAFLEGKASSNPKEPEKPVLTEEEFWQGNPVENVGKIVQKAVTDAVGKYETKTLTRMANRARRSHPDDFDATMKRFNDLAKNNPHLEQRMFDEHDNPYIGAYEYVKALDTQAEGDKRVEELEAKVAELTAKLNGDAPPEGKPPAAKPPKTQAGKRTAGASAVGSGSAPDPWGGR
jgi:BMFP domain-containing protein YqiC